jgi:hypothetical protein
MVVDARVFSMMFAAAALLAQPFPRGGSNGGTAPVSPSVLASEMSVVDANGRGRLELLILWRGSPGWFQKGGGGGSGGSNTVDHDRPSTIDGRPATMDLHAARRV